MNLSEIVKDVSKKLHISGTELAKRSGQSPQNLSKKLVRETVSYDEFVQLMEVMGAKVELSYTLPGSEKSKISAIDKHSADQLNIMAKQLEVEQLKNKYFTDMSFEFRTALETLRGGISLAKKNSSDSKKVEDYLDRIGPAVDILTRLVEDNPFNRQAGISVALGSYYGIRRKDDFAGRNVLLVEDNELNREFVKEILEDCGIIVSEASNGREAVKKVEKDDAYDFILMDLVMPVMDGCSAAEKIRGLEDKAKSATPIYAMTASVTREDRKRAEEAGMNGFMEKPLDINKLKEIVG